MLSLSFLCFYFKIIFICIQLKKKISFLACCSCFVSIHVYLYIELFRIQIVAKQLYGKLKILQYINSSSCQVDVHMAEMYGKIQLMHTQTDDEHY